MIKGEERRQEVKRSKKRRDSRNIKLSATKRIFLNTINLLKRKEKEGDYWEAIVLIIAIIELTHIRPSRCNLILMQKNDQTVGP